MIKAISVQMQIRISFPYRWLEHVDCTLSIKNLGLCSSLFATPKSLITLHSFWTLQCWFLLFFISDFRHSFLNFFLVFRLVLICLADVVESCGPISCIPRPNWKLFLKKLINLIFREVLESWQNRKESAGNTHIPPVPSHTPSPLYASLL